MSFFKNLASNFRSSKELTFGDVFVSDTGKNAPLAWFASKPGLFNGVSPTQTLDDVRALEIAQKIHKDYLSRFDYIAPKNQSTDIIWKPHTVDFSKPDARFAGDCDDYAMTTARALLAAGVPREKLGLAVGEQRGGQQHIVTTLNSGGRTYIIDNQRDEVVTYDKPGYFWKLGVNLGKPDVWHKFK